VNEAGLIVITNPAFDALFGYSRGMLIGRPLTSLSEALELSTLPRASAKGVSPWPLEFETRRPDGTTVTVAGAISQLDDAERRHGLLVLQDVGERKHLERALLEAVSREQDRIGNDLHDGLGQELTGIALMLRCLAGRLEAEHGAAPPEIDGITRLLNNAVENTRSLARGLSPVHLERGGLRDALEGLSMHARTVYGIKAAFTDKLPPDSTVETEVANHLYRIAQEAVTNAVKHGRAHSVRIHLTQAHGKLRLTIADDGCGMAATHADKRSNQSAGGMGLRIMRYRARIARGDVRFERGQPSGTRVICECPMDTHGAREQDRHSIARSHALSSEESRARMVSSHGAQRVRKTPAAKSNGRTDAVARRSTHAASNHSKGKPKLRAKGART
jgi:PAS domain S-box-containing protein